MVLSTAPLGLLEAVASLDVPVTVAEELATREGWDIWEILVASPFARSAAGDAARHLLEASESWVSYDQRFLSLMMAMQNGRHEVIDVVATDTRTPGWMVKWMVDAGWTTRTQHMSLARCTRSEDALWYLGVAQRVYHHAGALARTRRDRTVAPATWAATELICDEMGALVQCLAERPRASGERAGRVTPWAEGTLNTGTRWVVAERALTVLGAGDSEESLAAWRRLFDLILAQVSTDLAALIDSAARVGARHE